MLFSIIMATCFALLIIVLRAAVKNRVSKRFIYALWVLVFIRFVTPVSLFRLDILPAHTEGPQNEAVAYITRLVLPEQNTAETAYSAETAGSPEMQTAPSVQTVPAQTRDADITKALAVIWISGSAAVLAWAAASEIIVYSRLRKSRKLLYTRGRTKIYISENAPGACAYGLVPSIYLSPDAAASEGAGLLIAHETAHIRQFDCIREPLRKLLLAALWWDPAVWAYFLLARRDSELACDERVAKGLDERSRLNYARIIVDSASKTRGIALEIGGRPIKNRVNALINAKKTSAFALALAVVFVCALLAGSVCTLARAEAADQAQTEEKGVLSDPSDELPDISRTEAAKLLDDGAGNLRWPAELLPEGFPIPKYDGIYSVERTGGVLKIIMIGGFDLAKAEETARIITPENFMQYSDIMQPADSLLIDQLWKIGWITPSPASETRSVDTAADKYGNVITASRSYASSEDPDIQAAIALSGDVQYAWTLEYYRTEPRKSWFAEYPGKFDDIGIPQLGVVTEFPREYLPETLADLDKRVEVIETSVQHNGIRICVKDDMESIKSTYAILEEAGFVEINGLYIDEHGNTLYFYSGDTEKGTPCAILLVRSAGYNGQ